MCCSVDCWAKIVLAAASRVSVAMTPPLVQKSFLQFIVSSVRLYLDHLGFCAFLQLDCFAGKCRRCVVAGCGEGALEQTVRFSQKSYSGGVKAAANEDLGCIPGFTEGSLQERCSPLPRDLRSSARKDSSLLDRIFSSALMTLRKAATATT